MKLQTAKGSDLAGGGQYVDKPGTYHFLIDNVKVGLSSKDEPMDGSTIEMTCLAGEHADQAGRKIGVTLWDIDQSKSIEEQKQTINRLTNFFIAVNQIQPSQLGGEVDVDPVRAAGHQLVMKLGHKQKKVKDESGKDKWIDDPESKFLQIAYADIFHVDDPAVSKVAKSLDALKVIPSEHRHEGPQGKAWFDYKAKAATPGKSSDFDDDDDF